MRALLSVATAILLLCVGRPASAQEPVGIALLSLEISGDGPPELRQQLQENIVRGLGVNGARVIGLDSSLAALQSKPELIGCSSTECIQRIAELLDATLFVKAEVTASGANYELRLDLLRASEEQSVANSVSESCAVCTITELNELAVGAAQRLLTPDTDTLLTVTLASDPPGADLSIDGLPAGRSPLTIKLKAGEHRASASLDGYSSSEKTITVESGSKEQRFELLLTRKAAVAPPGEFGVWKWGALAGSGAFLILGTALVIVDGHPTCDSTVATCAELTNTMVGGVLSLSAGVLAGAASGWMFWRESQGRADEGGVSFNLGESGAMANYAFQF